MNRAMKLFLSSVLPMLVFVPVATRDALGQGESLRCVSLSAIDRTEALDNQTIAFYMKNDRIYINRLDVACPNLGPDEAISYRTTTGQLCSVDVITVIDNFSSGLYRGAACGLGEFQQVGEEEVEILRGERDPVEVTPEEVDVEQGEVAQGETERGEAEQGEAEQGEADE
jgi:hypothetical protein